MYIFILYVLQTHMCLVPISSAPSTTALFLYFILYPNSLEFVQRYFGKYLIDGSLKNVFNPYLMVFVNLYGMNTHIVDDLKLSNLTSLNAELENKHPITQWAHRSWPQHTGFIYTYHLQFFSYYYYLLNPPQSGFCSQHSTKNTIPKVINSAFISLRLSAAFVSTGPFLIFETLSCGVQDSDLPGSPFTLVATPS